jgi:hypothetical protein
MEDIVDDPGAKAGAHGIEKTKSRPPRYGKMPMRRVNAWYRESVRKFFSRGFETPR